MTLIEFFRNKNPWLSSSSIETLHRFDEENENMGLSDGTRNIQLYMSIQFLKETGKEFNDATEQDIRAVIRSKNASTTKENWKIFFKKFWTWYGKPELITWIKSAKNIGNKKRPEDMLTEQEIHRLIDACILFRDKTIIATLYDLALRKSELVGINLGDIRNDGNTVTITVKGKGNTIRTLGCISSAPFILKLIEEEHPLKHDIKAPLFYSLNPANYLGRLSKQSIWQIVKNASKRTNIQKRVHPHIFRHSRLTHLARLGMNEATMKLYAGWTDTSTQPATYIHMTNQDVIDITRELVTGEKPNNKRQKSILLPISCPRCGLENEHTRDYCSGCWLPLTQTGITKDNQLLELLKSGFANMHGMNLDKLLQDYEHFKVETAQIQQVYDCFNGSDMLSTDILRKQLGWPDDDVLNILGYLVSTQLVSAGDLQKGIVKIDKQQFQQFIDMQRRYVKQHN